MKFIKNATIIGLVLLAGLYFSLSNIIEKDLTNGAEKACYGISTSDLIADSDLCLGFSRDINPSEDVD